MTLYPTDRVALFIDGANLYSSARALNADLDFKKMVESFRDRALLTRAYYYTAVVEGEEFSPIRPLIDFLDYNGFRVVTKPVKRFTDGQGQTRTSRTASRATCCRAPTTCRRYVWVISPRPIRFTPLA